MKIMYLKQIFFSFFLAAFISCEKIEDKKYDECGNEICETCGGISMGAPNAIVSIIAYDPTMTSALSQLGSNNYVYVYDTQYPDDGVWLYALWSYIPNCESNENHIVKFIVDPGETLNWAAHTYDNSKTWAGSYRNKPCDDGEDCVSQTMNFN